MRPLPLAFALAALLVAGAALARDYEAGALTIGHPWARPAAAGANGAAYLSVTNNGMDADALIGASSPAAAQVTIHQMRMAGAVMSMRAVASIPIPPGNEIKLAPGGYHLMLEGLKRPLVLGQSVPATLRFRRAGAVRVELTVQPAPGESMPGMKM